jgi:hypothetical protein
VMVASPPRNHSTHNFVVSLFIKLLSINRTDAPRFFLLDKTHLNGLA